MTPDALLWLLTTDADEAIRDLPAAEITPAVIQRLRKKVGDVDRAAAIVELACLRQRAGTKFPEAEKMFFTAKSLEQATDHWIAAYKARRFADAGKVIDACCGVGGDLIALAKQTETVGVDADQVVAAFARRNSGAPVDVEMLARSLPDCDAWHADPDRRASGRRTSQPEHHEPSLSTLDNWREQTPDAAVKLAPAAKLPDDWQEQCELEWISRAGECRQLVAWSGRLAVSPGRRRATRIDSDHADSLLGEPAQVIPTAEALGEWLYDPDPSVLAANLVGALCKAASLAAATPAVPYLTADDPSPHPLVASFRVIETMSFDRKRLSAWLHDQEIGRLEIKCRGVDIRPEQLRKELKPQGDSEATLLIFPDRDRRTRVVVANRAGRSLGDPHV